MLDKMTENGAETTLQPIPVDEQKSNSSEFESILAKGKRNLMCKEIPEAVNQLQEASRLVAEKFGETANECAEVYLQYGLALLELARMENTVLGNALTGIPAEPAEEEEEAVVAESTFVEPDDTTEEEKAKISDEIIDAMVESDAKDKNEKAEEENGSGEQAKDDAVDAGGDAKNSTEVPSSEADGDAQEKKQDSETPEEATESGDVAEEGEGEEDGDAEEGEGEEDCEDVAENTEEAMEEDKNNASQDDVTNLQLAWEMIELSKSIYKRGELNDAKLKEADCLLRLGEIGLETEQYSQAVSDFEECLAILESTVEPSNRRLAETHYQVALAHGYNNAFDDAISHFNSAIDIIELKINELNKISEPNEKSNGTEATEETREAAKKELEELQNLIPEIKIKIDDAKEEKKAQCLKEVIRQSFKSNLNGEEGTSSVFQSGDASSASSSSSAVAEKPVQDITHLVRKKRKVEEDEGPKSAEKKSKTDVEEVTESDCKLNGSTETTPTNGLLKTGNVDGSVETESVKTASTEKEPTAESSVETKAEPKAEPMESAA